MKSLLWGWTLPDLSFEMARSLLASADQRVARVNQGEEVSEILELESTLCQAEVGSYRVRSLAKHCNVLTVGRKVLSIIRKINIGTQNKTVSST